MVTQTDVRQEVALLTAGFGLRSYPCLRNENEPAVRPFTMEELEQLDKVHEDECELAFESVNDLFPALERNGTAIRNNLWTGISMTKPQTPLPVYSHTVNTKIIYHSIRVH